MSIRFSGRLFLFLAALTPIVFSISCSPGLFAPTSTPAPTATPTPEWARPGWELVWQDEFKDPQIDKSKWGFEIGGNGWGNSELEYYSDRPENARIENGHLIIEARKDSYMGSQYSSARLKTQNLGEWTYGRIESRIRIPEGQGIWPAFWMLGNNIGRVGWPASGEIDIMENIGKEPNRIHGTIHGPGYSGAQGLTSPYELKSGAFADDFHVYAIEWEAAEIRWYVDDQLYKSIGPEDMPGKWVFDHPFFILLNVAVGGGWPGYPNSTTIFPQTMQVDYVRVYKK